MVEKKLGFGFMRLPLLDSTDQKSIDFDQLEQMVDEYLEAGFTYFDTSFAYHNGTSEAALKRVLVDRCPRDRFTIATKFPTFAVQTEDQVEGILAVLFQYGGHPSCCYGTLIAKALLIPLLCIKKPL